MSLIHSANELNRLINKSNDVINNTKLKLERERRVPRKTRNGHSLVNCQKSYHLEGGMVEMITVNQRS